MAAHAMSEDTHAVTVQLLEFREKGFGQLVRDVAVHFVSFAPGLLGRVDVKACAGAEVVGFVFTGDLEAAWKQSWG